MQDLVVWRSINNTRQYKIRIILFVQNGFDGQRSVNCAYKYVVVRLSHVEETTQMVQLGGSVQTRAIGGDAREGLRIKDGRRRFYNFCKPQHL